MKNILIVSYHFPPDAAVGSIRVAKFARYLPEFGWLPFVLTAKETVYGGTDQSRMTEIMDLDKIFRTVAWPGPSAVYMRIKKWWYCIRGREHSFQEEINEYRQADQEGAESRLGRMRYFLLSIISVADREFGWFPPAMLRALLIMNRHKMNCVLTSGPPHAAHLVGLVLKKVHGTRWIADFRDPWTIKTIRAGSIKSKLSQGIEKWMETQVVTYSDQVVSVTE